MCAVDFPALDTEPFAFRQYLPEVVRLHVARLLLLHRVGAVMQRAFPSELFLAVWTLRVLLPVGVITAPFFAVFHFLVTVRADDVVLVAHIW